MTSPLLTGNILTASPWVACNIYISAGRPYYYSLLNELLIETIQHCRTLRSEVSINNNKIHRKHPITNRIDSKIALIHAYADPPYNRSSFHLAGHGSAIEQVVSNLAIQALDRLSPLIQHEKEHQEQRNNTIHDTNLSTRHPFVGLIDHISILPLHLKDDASSSSSSHQSPPLRLFDSHHVMDETTRTTALLIATTLEKKGVHVLKYGSAHPQNLSLAMIRKTQTNFFQSNSISGNNHSNIKNHMSTNITTTTTTSADSSSSWGICTVGSPLNFVENVNIRLSSTCSKSIAQSLTRKLRGRNNGGIPGLEALTLPYSYNRWEVACNLLQPCEDSMRQIENVCKDWELLQNTISGNINNLIESIYRVGTTKEQCLQILDIIHEEEEIEIYENALLENFYTYVHSSS